MDRPAAKVNFLRARDFASRIVTPQQCELLAGCPSHAQCKVLRRSNRGDLLPWITYFGSPLLWVHLHEQTWVNFYERRGAISAGLRDQHIERVDIVELSVRDM